MGFRDRLRAGEVLAATWVKTPSPIIVEVLALTGLDCLVLDAEHAPFDRVALDLCLLAARAGGKTVLVRPPTAAPEHILNALDCGADGVILPHVCSAADAVAAVAACTYQRGGRGYAGSSRAAGYTTRSMAAHRSSATGVTIIAQIEDVEAVDAIDAIAAVPGIDALFIGRADLTVAYGADGPDDPEVVAAVERICAAGIAAGRTVGMFLGRAADVPYWRTRGATLFILGSDHDFILRGAAQLVENVIGTVRIP
ncbi:MAG: HpcH/HpaI aldolase family protein [Janthinobacterium lividum]